jgi:osmotically-inducible protein OsmY
MEPSSDQAIHHAVLAELHRDPDVDETDVGVEVDHAIVTLTGTVSTWATRHAAELAAHRAPGVLDVANDIDVRLPGVVGRTDTDIAAMVRRALAAHPSVPDAQITTTVSAGVVTLTGTVSLEAQRLEAAACVNAVSSVRGVVNRIELDAGEG